MAIDFGSSLNIVNPSVTITSSNQWVQNYQQASFRGVPFFISRASNTIGRRNVTHEFPNQDNIYTEDLGLKLRVFTFDAYIIGSDYWDHRNRLIEALETKGPGRLVHPYRGAFDVVLDDATMVEDSTEGRIARFSLTFKEQKTIELTESVRNPFEETYTNRGDLLTAAKTLFQEAYNLTQKPIHVLNETFAELDRVADLILDAKKVTGSYSDYQRLASNFKGKILQIRLDAGSLWDSFQEIVTFGTDVKSRTSKPTTDNARNQFLEMDNIMADANRPVYNPSDLKSVVSNMPYLQALASQSGLTSTINYDSQDDVNDVIAVIYSRMNDVLNNNNWSDDVLLQTRNLKASTLRDAELKIKETGRLFEYQINGTSEPTLVIANRIYGDISKEQEIIDRNKIKYPAFTPGYKPVKVVISE